MKRTGLSLIKIISGLVFVAALNMKTMQAQYSYLESIPSHPLPYTLYTHTLPDTTNEMNSFGEDTLMVEVKPKLLPDNISFGEKIFWGENGFFRSVGIASPLLRK